MPAIMLIALPNKNEKHLGICPPFCMVEKRSEGIQKI
jgi:hypothetical protein